jgi:hypothetical protein
MISMGGVGGCAVVGEWHEEFMKGGALLMSFFLTRVAAFGMRESDYRTFIEMLKAMPQLSALSLSGAP